MAQFGDDRRISLMLLEVARDMDAEAEAIEVGQPNEQHRSLRYNPGEAYPALLHLVADDPVVRPVQIIDLSFRWCEITLQRFSYAGNRAAWNT
jgi:hypothetical protein